MNDLCPCTQSKKPLDRQKLDVINQAQSNLFGWRGQFTSEFVAQDLRQNVHLIFSAQSL